MGGLWGRLWSALRGEAAGNLMALLACTGVSQACGLGIVLLSARHLGQAGLGVFLFALTVTNYLTLIGGAGAGQVLIREVAGGRERTDEHVTAYLMLTGAMTAAVTAAAGLVVWLAASGDERAMWGWLLVGNVAGSVSLLPLFDAQHRQARAAAVMAAVDLLNLGCFAWAAWSGRLSVPLAGAFLGGKWLLVFLGQLAVYHWTVRPLRWRPEGADVGLFAWSGLRLLVAYLLLLVPLNGGVVLVRLLRTPEETAVMGIAAQVAVIYTTVCWQIQRLVQPYIMAESGASLDGAMYIGSRFAQTIGGIGVVCVGAALALIWGYMRPAYGAAAGPIVLLVASVCILHSGGISGIYLHKLQRESAVVQAQAIGCCIFLLLGIPACYWFGTTGAAATTLLAFGCGSSLLVANHYRAIERLRVECAQRGGPVLSEARRQEDKGEPGDYGPQGGS